MNTLINDASSLECRKLSRICDIEIYTDDFSSGNAVNEHSTSPKRITLDKK